MRVLNVLSWEKCVQWIARTVISILYTFWNLCSVTSNNKNIYFFIQNAFKIAEIVVFWAKWWFSSPLCAQKCSSCSENLFKWLSAQLNAQCIAQLSVLRALSSERIPSPAYYYFRWKKFFYAEKIISLRQKF